MGRVSEAMAPQPLDQSAVQMTVAEAATPALAQLQILEGPLQQEASHDRYEREDTADQKIVPNHCEVTECGGVDVPLDPERTCGKDQA